MCIYMDPDTHSISFFARGETLTCEWVGCSLKWDNNNSFTSSNQRFKVSRIVNNRTAWGSRKEDSTSILFYCTKIAETPFTRVARLSCLCSLTIRCLMLCDQRYDLKPTHARDFPPPHLRTQKRSFYPCDEFITQIDGTFLCA